MKHLDNDTTAAIATGISGMTWLAHKAVEIQSIVSVAAGFVAILSGLMAFIYHLIKTWQRLKHQ
jgi:hypothetical protein